MAGQLDPVLAVAKGGESAPLDPPRRGLLHAHAQEFVLQGGQCRGDADAGENAENGDESHIASSFWWLACTNR